ncbi:IS66 family insertion sequence element accessory protein TnpA, partial [Massilia mucilaginosa]
MVANVEQINEWQARVARWQASGLSQRAFAIENGVSQRQVSYWARRLGEAQLSPAF